MALVPFDSNAPSGRGLTELARLTPRSASMRRWCAAASSGWATRSTPTGSLGGLAEQRVDYILIGWLARVLQGADEVPGGVDLVFPKGGRFATDDALRAIARPAPGRWPRRRCLGVPERRRRVHPGARGTAGDQGPPRPSPAGRARPSGWGASPTGGGARRPGADDGALGRAEQAEPLEAMRRGGGARPRARARTLLSRIEPTGPHECRPPLAVRHVNPDA